MHWSIAAPFFNPGNKLVWIDDFIPGQRHSFTKIVRDIPNGSDWHARLRHATPLRDWLSYWNQARSAIRKSTGGIITLFPQLPALVGLNMALPNAIQRPVLAWCYNIGNLPGGLRQFAARLCMKHISHIVVHSTGEIAVIARWLNFPEDRISFVHLQIGDITLEFSESTKRPFALAMGSAGRDYATLFEAVRRTKIPTIVVASPRATQGLDPPSHLELRSGLTQQECRQLAQEARMSIVPLLKTQTAAGQVTIVEAMRMCRPIIVARSVGTVDYIKNGINGLEYQVGNSDDLASSMQRLWDDTGLRNNLGKNAFKFVKANCSDHAAAMTLQRKLDMLAGIHQHLNRRD